MSMMSFRDVLGAVAAKGVATAPSPVPAPAPFLAAMAEQAEAIVETPIVEAVKPQQAPAAPPVSGFGAMLHRVAAQTGVPVVSILDEAAPAPVVQPATSIDESLLAGLATGLSRAADRLDGTPPSHDDLHAGAHNHIANAMDSLFRAHSAVKQSLNSATDETHKAHLTHTLASLSQSISSVGHAKEAGNLGNHHNMKITGKLP